MSSDEDDLGEFPAYDLPAYKPGDILRQSAEHAYERELLGGYTAAELESWEIAALNASWSLPAHPTDEGRAR